MLKGREVDHKTVSTVRLKYSSGFLFSLAFLFLIAYGGVLTAKEVTPLTTWGVGSDRMGYFSGRTISMAISVDRDTARLISYTVKDRPFLRTLLSSPVVPYREGRPVQIELVLTGENSLTFTKRVEIAGLCLDHPAGTAPHIAGDTIRVHRESVIIEAPEIAGFDHFEVSYYSERDGRPTRMILGKDTLGPESFTAAGGKASYADLAFAKAPITQGESPTAGTGHWPAEYSDPDIYTVYGNAAEISSRINIVIVPDGYTYAEKATMQSHAQAMVDYFRQKTPFKEHDSFINYILVYAYSSQSGTDQCDCSIVKDTAMGTGFAQVTPVCGDSSNRCLYYGDSTSCDPTTSPNITAAELRAPAQDETLVMVNTSRYGGCGGSRAVYSAASTSAVEIAVHELGHSLAGLADEYATTAACGTYAGEVNTSLNSGTGAWPEWTADLGAPQEGAQDYQSCVYRPSFDCDMRNLNMPFCPVCNQRWSLAFFGHARVNPTAPISSMSPSSPLNTLSGIGVNFSVGTRLSTGAGVTNSLIWQIQGPGYPTPTTVASGTADYSHTFASSGVYTLTCEVIADTNFVKPSKTGANRDLSTWTVNVSQNSQSITVTSPNGVENWVVNENHPVEWTSSNLNSAGSLYLSYWDGIQEIQIAGPLASTATSFNWAIPNTPTAQAKIFVGNWLGSAYEITDESNAVFTIASATEVVFSDDFSDRNYTIPLWTTKGNWSASTGDAVGVTAKKADLVSPIFFCTTCTFEANISIGATGRASLFVWYQDSSHNLEIRLMQDKQTLFVKQKYGALSKKVKITMSISPDTIYDVKANFDGSQFTVLVGGASVLRLTPIATPSGRALFRTQSTTGLRTTGTLANIVVSQVR